MGWISREFECKCGWFGDDLLKSDEPQVLDCPECGTELTPVLSAPAIGGYSIQDAAGRADILKRRSAEHTAKEMAKEPEKYGDAGKETYMATKTSKTIQVKKKSNG